LTRLEKAAVMKFKTNCTSWNHPEYKNALTMAADVEPEVRETTGDAGEPITALVDLTENELESPTEVFKTSTAVVETPTGVETDRLLDLTMDIIQEPSVIVTPDAVGLVDLTTKTDVRPSLVDGTQVS
jgi:hypothetical protein